MNYLAHAYLSYNIPDILVGNLISDFVKGKKKFEYSAGIQKGIAIHRAIDQYTDNHAITKIAREVFRPHYRLYAGAFVDVVYDHFLARDPELFKAPPLLHFTEEVYRQTMPYLPELPAPFQKMFPYMKEQNWLYHYQFREGMRKAFGGLVRRSTYLTESETAFSIFELHYDHLQQCYNHYFPQLVDHVFKEYGIGR